MQDSVLLRQALDKALVPLGIYFFTKSPVQQELPHAVTSLLTQVFCAPWVVIGAASADFGACAVAGACCLLDLGTFSQRCTHCNDRSEEAVRGPMGQD